MPSPQSLLALSSWYSNNLPFGSPGFGTTPDYNKIWGSSIPLNKSVYAIPSPTSILPKTELFNNIDPDQMSKSIYSDRMNQMKSGEGLQKGLSTAGTVASFIPGLQGLGIGLNIGATLLGIGRAIKSSSDADKMTSPYLPAPEEVKKPYTGVTSAEYAAQKSGINNLYATTVRAGQLLGRDTSTAALAQSIEAGRQIAGQNAEINRRAAELGVNIDQFNTQAYQQWARDKAGLDWQTEAMKAGIKSEAWQSGVQGVLNLGQGIVGMGNMATSYAMATENTIDELKMMYADALASGPSGILQAQQILDIIKEKQKLVNNPWSIYGFGKRRLS